MSVEEPFPRSPLLVVLGGRTARSIRDIDMGTDVEVLVLDTDSRTERNFPRMNVVTVGSRIVHGEGSGGNMNLARACFRLDMDRIAPLVLGRPLVVLLTSTEGATGMAGAVEVSSLLIKVGMSCFSFLLHQDSRNGSGLDPLRIASILLDGPLRPGCIIVGGQSTCSTPEDPFGLRSVLPPILQSASNSRGLPAPQSAWAALREDGGPFSVGTLSIPSDPTRTDIFPPALVSLRVPEGMTNIEVRSRLASAFPDPEGIHFALITSGGTGEMEGAFISKSLQKTGPQERETMDPGTLKDLLGDPDSINIEPSFKIMEG
ncbi:MAG: hypothetical protein JW939_03875 [Candidatus Thermoplasmatota archaeon]|nr:hypothetical protein [Candidatus Thermoplasmatota archaeon]